MTNRSMSEILRRQVPLILPPEASMREACAAMAARRVGAVLVVRGGRLAGIFTGRDAVRALADGVDPSSRLAEVMTRDPATRGPTHTAIDALRMMRDGGFRHVPVVRDGVVLGVVSRGDFRGLEQDRLEAETLLWERMA